MTVRRTAARYSLMGVDQIDAWLDRVPTVSTKRNKDGGTLTFTVYRYGGWGCVLGLSKWVADKDEKYDLGIYREPTMVPIVITRDMADQMAKVSTAFAAKAAERAATDREETSA